MSADFRKPCELPDDAFTAVNAHRDRDLDLAITLGYLLAQSPLRPKGHLANDQCVAIAKSLVAELKAKNWRFEQVKPQGWLKPY